MTVVDDKMAAMDVAAEKALQDLRAEMVDNPDALEIVAQWWRRWYGEAGHKRLGRALVATLPKDEDEE